MIIRVFAFFVIVFVACATQRNALEVSKPQSEVVSSTEDELSQLGIGEVYDTRIGMVQFSRLGSPLTLPSARLNSEDEINLSFDLLGDDIEEYRYTIVHCDADWRPSDLNQNEYLENFFEADLFNGQLSFNTISKYVHYSLTLPNRDIAWKVSGNYLLELRSDYTGELIMRHRFMVFEDLDLLEVFPTRPAVVAKDRTHQEFDVSFDLSLANFDNPRRTLSLAIIQNRDWRTGIHNIKPRFLRDNKAVWDYQNQIVFEGLREWRNIDIRTIKSTGGRVFEIVRNVDEYTIYLQPDIPRLSFERESYIDLNGGFFIEDFDNFRDLQGEYSKVVFALKMERNPSIEPLYLYGSLTHYRMDEDNQGYYNELTNAYTFGVPLRQGAYDFTYVSQGEDGLRPVFAAVEGNQFITENDYSFMLYYRPFGARYDRLVSYNYFKINGF